MRQPQLVYLVHARHRAADHPYPCSFLSPPQRVIELGRTIRERRNKPLKSPLTKLVVVHSDTDFLADIQGGCMCITGGNL